MTPGMSRGLKKGARTIAQVIAAGGLTALVTAIAGGLSPQMSALVLGAFTAVAAFCMNWAEGASRIPVLLPTPSLITGPAAEAVATVEAVADHTGDIVGEVLDIGGDVVGEVVGQLSPDKDGEQGGAGLVALFVVIFFVLLAAGGMAACDLLINDESEEGDLSGRITLVSHDYDDDSGDQRYDQRYGSEDDRNRNRDRNRGAFSPGPFDDSPVTITICAVPDSCPQNPPPEEGAPQ